MTVRSLSFDDEDDEDLYVFAGYDLMLSHHDIADLDWHEIAERSAIDERRGLIITQVIALEDLVDEFLMYLADPPDVEAYQYMLDTKTIGPRINLFEQQLQHADLLDNQAREYLDELRVVVRRRNQLAHGILYRRPVEIIPIKHVHHRDVELEWRLLDRRSRESERVSMARLRQDLHQAVGVFDAMLTYGESFVERAPRPDHYKGGTYLSAPKAERS